MTSDILKEAVRQEAVGCLAKSDRHRDNDSIFSLQKVKKILYCSSMESQF